MSAYYREWLERHCKEEQALLYFSIITCAYCDEVFIKSEKNYIRTFIKHLHDLHKRTELDGHSRCKELKEKFEIKQNQLFVGVCKEQTCKLQIIFFRGVHLLQNHLEICHGNRSSIYLNVIRQNMKAQHILLNNYLITSDDKAHCLICKDQVDLSDLELETEEILDILQIHWANHFIKMQWDDIYRLEQLQQRVDKKLMKEQISHDIEKTYLEFPSEEIIKKLQNFDKIIEEVVDCLEYSIIISVFKMMRMSECQNLELRCICCLRKIIDIGRIHIIKNHWELYHGLFSLTYKEIIDIKIVRDILDQYVILNNILVCLNCKDLFKVNALLLDIEEQLVILLKHWHIHIGISSDDQIKQEEYLRKEFRRKLNGEKELVDMLENSGRDDQGQQSSNRDDPRSNTSTESSGSSISIDTEADCKYTVNFAPSRQSEERQSTSAQSPSTSVSSNDSPPAKQRKKESDNIDLSEYQ
ncbi:PREDICTED: uncharacterized protein LOC105150157 [Acromyrmex echinatior]|uniref:uncharacterized protein LOC105150157 n=1 Tax=Acromyrmex echinatior TaxID=103372 RepID=UPI000580E87F|nr:PREDICTED: uncharacterized protein LOC105150157 [Acromyrmex echinatior]